MINHSQFCFRGILWFSHKIAPYSVGCPTFGVQSILLSGLCPPMVIVVYGHCCADNQKHDDMAEINAKIPHHASECAAA